MKNMLLIHHIFTFIKNQVSLKKTLFNYEKSMIHFSENDETVQRILVEYVSADWKRLARYICLHDIDSVVGQIDCDYSTDQSKMAAFLNKLFKLYPLNYKKLIVNSLNVASRFDVLFRIALVGKN